MARPAHSGTSGGSVSQAHPNPKILIAETINIYRNNNNNSLESTVLSTHSEEVSGDSKPSPGCPLLSHAGGQAHKLTCPLRSQPLHEAALETDFRHLPGQGSFSWPPNCLPFPNLSWFCLISDIHGQITRLHVAPGHPYHLGHKPGPGHAWLPLVVCLQEEKKLCPSGNWQSWYFSFKRNMNLSRKQAPCEEKLEWEMMTVLIG